MEDKPFLPKSQNVTWKELLAALVVVAYGITAIIILTFYSRLWGGLMIGIPMVLGKGYWLFWERNHKNEMAQARKNFDESGLGKTFNYGLNVLIVGVVIFFLYRFIVS
ncbi:MAG: hypothetical protein OEZ51_10860 [Nitrospinota bacterium]|nr:hypothetical protein [Nitrospinota bacterium]